MPVILVPRPLEAVCEPGFWRFSKPVPKVERPVRAEVPVDLVAQRKRLWFQALDEGLPNAGEKSLGYDDWFRVVSAIHHELGPEEGLAVAQWWSARSGKHDPEFLAERVWPYLKSDREKPVTGGTVMSMATRLSGWHGVPDASGFEAVDDKGRPIVQLGLVLGENPDVLHGEAVSERMRRDREEIVTSQRVRTGELNGSARLEADPDDWTGLAGAVSPAGVVVPRSVLLGVEELIEEAERNDVPPAHHVCTDQANANRLVREFGAHLMVAGGQWYVWSGRHWARDEAGVYRRVCQLSGVIMAEAAQVRGKAGREFEAGGIDADGVKAAEKVATALEKWSAASEMGGHIETCVRLAKRMLTVDVESLDKNVWLLNCWNGTVDLRTGALKAHDLRDRLTRVAPVAYRAGARSPCWERLLKDVCCADAGLVRFLRRWLGYCCTGATLEQKFLIHWGTGGNGKSTVMDAVARVLGGYASTAPSSLVASRKGAEGSGVHSSAVVDLVGRRFVCAHESDEGAVLNEGFVKMATGSDMMPARYLYAEQFNFRPSHKFNVLTQHKPVIRGTDRGIWRRVLLMPWVASFGSAEAVARGEARSVADPSLAAILQRPEDSEGILADLVRAAVEWFNEGLAEPDCVRAAVDGYRNEQDRLAQFVDECCEVGEDYSVPLTTTTREEGLYPAYCGWCKEAGTFPVSKQRFTAELARVVPRCRTSEHRVSMGSVKRKILQVHGLRIAELGD